MRKKVMSLLLCVSIMLSIAAGCGKKEDAGGSANTPAPAKVDTNPFEKEITYTAVSQVLRNAQPEQPSLLDNLLKEKFNITVKWDYVSVEFLQKVRLLFAAGDIPDMIFHGTKTMYDELAANNYLLPVNKQIDKLPNYKKIWEGVPGGWDQLLKANAIFDGNMYYTPTKNIRTVSEAWIYRKSAFDSMELTFPKTMEELYTTLKTIKAKNPDSIPIVNRNGFSNLFKGFSLAYRVKSGCYIDPDTGNFVPAGEITDQYREALKMINRMYADGLIDKEFATTTQQQYDERYATGKPFIEYSYGTRADWANGMMKKVDPQVKWEWSKDNITAYPDKGWLYGREEPFFKNGLALTNKMKDDRLERILKYIDWSASAEGSDFLSWGVEGKTFEVKDGKRQFTSQIWNAVTNPNGKYLNVYTGYDQDYIPNRLRDSHIATGQGAVTYDVSDHFDKQKGYKFFNFFYLNYTKEEDTAARTLSATIGDVLNEYQMKFAMGQLNPADDKIWQAYKDALNKAGMEKLMKLYTDVYNKSK